MKAGPRSFLPSLVPLASACAASSVQHVPVPDQGVRLEDPRFARLHIFRGLDVVETAPGEVYHRDVGFPDDRNHRPHVTVLAGPKTERAMRRLSPASVEATDTGGAARGSP